MQLQRSSSWRAWEIARRGIPLGIDRADGRPLHLSLERLETHLHIVGPPGFGKTRVLFGLFQSLCWVPGATVVLINPKGKLGRMARDWVIANGLAKRLVWFDPGDAAVCGYNPLRPNGSRIATHAKSLRESIRSAWGESSFDQMPQLARLMFLALAWAREMGGTLVDALRILQPGNRQLRRQLLSLPAGDTMRRELLAHYDSLKDARQEELAASSIARLESFVADESIRRILTHSPSMDLRELIRGGGVLIANLELKRPLVTDDVKLLGRFLVSDIVNHVMERPEGERRPVFILCDEIELFATRDLCSVLDLGRELGLHLVAAHQHLGQLKEEEKSGYLYDSMMTCARTKIVFGGLTEADLAVLTPELFIDQFNPYAVKDELTSLELRPQESSRLVITGGLQGGYTRGRNRSHTKSRTETSTSSDFSAFNMGHGRVVSSGRSEPVYGDGMGASAPLEILFDGESAIDTDGEAYGWQETLSKGNGEAETGGRNAAGHGGASLSVSRVPFYEYDARRNVSSRTFVTEAEFLTMCRQKLKAQPKAHFAVKTDGHPALFCQARFVPDPKISDRRCVEAMSQVCAAPFYFAAVDDPPASYHPEASMLEFSQPPPDDFGE